MKFDMKKIATAAVLSVAVVGGTLSTTAPAQATHILGHAIAGGIIGGIIGGAIVSGARRRPVYVAPPVYIAPAPAPIYGGLPPQHYNWCFNRFRSYHAASNTYQPFGGYPRRQCRSPWY